MTFDLFPHTGDSSAYGMPLSDTIPVGMFSCHQDHKALSRSAGEGAGTSSVPGGEGSQIRPAFGRMLFGEGLAERLEQTD